LSCADIAEFSAYTDSGVPQRADGRLLADLRDEAAGVPKKRGSPPDRQRGHEIGIAAQRINLHRDSDRGFFNAALLRLFTCVSALVFLAI
jgi:hypothetical protein